MKAPKMRRSVSLAAVTYVRMWLHCHREGLKMAAWVDELVNAELDMLNVAPPSQEQAYAAIQSIREAKVIKTQRAKLRRVAFAMERATVEPSEPSTGVFHSGNGHFL